MIEPRLHLKNLYRSPDDPESHLPYLRLDKNERVAPFPPDIWNRFIDLLSQDAVMAYPELNLLYENLAKYINASRSDLFFATGSDLAIKTVYETYIAPGDIVQIHAPNYAMHEVYGQMFQAHMITIPYDRKLHLDMDAYTNSITPLTRMVVLENPNGMIGACQSFSAVRAMVEKAHQCNALVLLDEAYYLFHGETIQALYQEFDNVIIVRTFSKDFGIAGLRCGYLLSQPKNIESVYRVKPMHEINSAAVAFSLAMLERPDYIQSFVNEMRNSINYTIHALNQMGLTVSGGAGNFVVVYLGADVITAAIISYLKEHGILIRRPFTADNLKGWLRIAIGSMEQMQQFISVFTKALKASNWQRNSYNPPISEI